jgi:hypothetical protein
MHDQKHNLYNNMQGLKRMYKNTCKRAVKTAGNLGDNDTEPIYAKPVTNDDGVQTCRLKLRHAGRKALLCAVCQAYAPPGRESAPRRKPQTGGYMARRGIA